MKISMLPLQMLVFMKRHNLLDTTPSYTDVASMKLKQDVESS